MHGDEEQLFKGDACRAEVQSPRHAYHSHEILRPESDGAIKDFQAGHLGCMHDGQRG